MSDEKFDFNEFVASSVYSLKDPKGYFSDLKPTGGYAQPFIKAIIYGLLAAVISWIWTLMGLSMPGAGWFGTASGPWVLIVGIMLSILAVAIGAVIVLVFSAICGGSTAFEANLRVAASLMVLSPIGSLFEFLNSLSGFLFSAVSLLLSLYGLYMLYNAMIYTLKARPAAVKTLIIVLLVLLVFFTVLGWIAGAIFGNVESYQWQ